MKNQLSRVPDFRGNYKAEKLVIVEMNVCSNSKKILSELQNGGVAKVRIMVELEFQRVIQKNDATE